MGVRIAASQHQKKAAPFLRALVDHGHQLVPGEADAFLLDVDTTYNRHLYDARLERGEKVFLYPHGHFTAWFYDGPMDPDPRITAHFVVSEGVQEVYRRIGMTMPTYVVGFPWSELRPFRPATPPRKILFGPHHPLGDGRIRPEVAALNRRIFESLLELDIELTVRHIMDVERNGLYHVDGVDFVQAQPDNGTAQIDEADAVVGGGTFAYLAVARGVPTVMYDQSEPPENHNRDGSVWRPQSWDRYADYVRYPYDISDGPIGELLDAAGASDDAIRDWRERFIGRQFDPSAFALLFSDLCREPVLESELRERAVIAWADEIARRPDLLAAYARRFAGDDRTTLVLYAPDADEEAIVADLQRAIDGCGIAEADLPDMLLTVLPRYASHERTMAQRAFAVLTDRDIDGPLADLPSAMAADSGIGVRA